MPFDVLGCTRVTMTHATSYNIPGPMGLGNLFKVRRDGDRALQLLFLNEEFLVVVGHQLATDYVPALCTHRPSLLPMVEPMRTRDELRFYWLKGQRPGSRTCSNLFN